MHIIMIIICIYVITKTAEASVTVYSIKQVLNQLQVDVSQQTALIAASWLSWFLLKPCSCIPDVVMLLEHF